MNAHKLAATCIFALPLFVLSTEIAAYPSHDSVEYETGEGVPHIPAVERRFLTQLARRTMVSAASGDQPYEPVYVPPSLSDVECQIVVRLRRKGYNCGIGISEPGLVAQACQEGATRAYGSAKLAGFEGLEFLSDATIEIEALGPLYPYPEDKKWTEPGALDAFIEPGVDGVSITLDDDQRWFTPGEMLAKNVSMDEALRTLFKELSLDPASIPSGRLARFRTLHWWEPAPNRDVVLLRRGMTSVDPSAVVPEVIEASIEKLTHYLVYRQLPDGGFRHTFDPSADIYMDENPVIADSTVAWALACRAASASDKAAHRASEAAIEALRKRIIVLPDVENAGFVATPDAKNKLGVTAQLCLALAESPDADRYATQRTHLANAMLWLQLPTGKIVTAFPPAQVLPVQDVYPGQALFALARCYESSPSQEILDTFDRALGFYQQLFTEDGPPLMVPWQARAFAAMARMTKKRAYADFVFRMCDAATSHQLLSANSPYPELWGAITAPGLPASASTAAFVAALADAAELASQFGDEQRHRDYASAAVWGARFVMQLQFREVECYFVRSVQDTVNGIRRSPIDCRISSDDCAEAIIALTCVKQLLQSVEP